MIALEQQIYELRAELQDCHLTSPERIEAEAELVRAIRKLSELECELDREFAAFRREFG